MAATSRNLACKFIIILGILIFVSVENAFAQTDIYLKVHSQIFQRMEIDLYPFTAETQSMDSEVLAGTITEVLKNDLWMSGYFKVNLKYGAPENGNGVAEKGGALTSVNGTFSFDANSVRLQPNVIDNTSGRFIIRTAYDEVAGNERTAIHRLADDIVYTLTGEPGIANSKIAYIHEGEDGTKEVAVMDYDGHRASILTSDKNLNLSPAWSPNGHKICYTSFKDDNPNLYVYNLKTNTQIQLSALHGLNSAPSWSPDGARLAITLSKDGNAEIYILDVEKKQLQRLTYNRAIDSSPGWAPSNRDIVFTSDRSGSPQVYIMDSDGLNVRRLTFEGNYNDSPSWSPRGDRIAYVSRTDSGFDIYTIDTLGENRMRLTDSAKSNEDPCWSPNGFSIVFSSNRNGKRALYSMFWDGTDQKKLTNVGVNYMPAWSTR